MAGKFNLAEHIQAAQPPAPRDIEVITGEILDAKQRAGEAILSIGNNLIEAKAMLSHGEWVPWLSERVYFSETTAQRYMQLARRFSNPATLRDLGYSKALALLALPEKTMDEFIETPHVVGGEEKPVSDMSVRELKAAIRERDEALKAAEQAKADQKAADAAREKMSTDMALANERIKGLNAQVEEQSTKAREAQEIAAKLEKELLELRSRPVEVAVEVDASAVDAARKETKAAMQAKLDKAKKAQAEAEAAKKAAEAAIAKVQQELEQAKDEARAIREQAARAEKKAAIAANEDLVLFSTLFDQVQDLVNKLGGVLMKIRNKDPEKAEGLKNALLALADKIKEVAEG